MDDRLTKAIDHANYASTIARQKKNLQLRYENNLLYSQNGGTFTASPELISFVDIMIRQGREDTILVDSKKNPIRITDLSEFLENLVMTYHQAANELFLDYETLRKARNVKSATKL